MYVAKLLFASKGRFHHLSFLPVTQAVQRVGKSTWRRILDRSLCARRCCWPAGSEWLGKRAAVVMVTYWFAAVTNRCCSGSKNFFTDTIRSWPSSPGWPFVFPHKSLKGREVVWGRKTEKKFCCRWLRCEVRRLPMDVRVVRAVELIKII
jgi:hypothetical protein